MAPESNEPKPRDRWPERVEGKRVEAKDLADEVSKLANEADALILEDKDTEARLKMAQVQANSERIARLMAESRSPLS